MNKIVLILSCSLLTFSVFSQSKRDYNWLLGYESDNFIEGIEGNLISFHGGTRDTSYQNIGVGFGTNNAIISDEEGNLLCYANGCAIVNRHHEIMEKGDGINPGDIHDEQCTYGYPGIQQGILLSEPENEHGVYYIYSDLTVIYEPEIEVENRLYYSRIDMSDNDGDGKVIEKNIPLLTYDLHFAGYLTACLHQNGKDWWLFRVKRNSNLYYKILLDEMGIAIVDSFNIGPEIMHSGGGGKVYLAPMDSYTSPMTSVMTSSSMILIVARVISAISVPWL